MKGEKEIAEYYEGKLLGNNKRIDIKNVFDDISSVEFMNDIKNEDK